MRTRKLLLAVSLAGATMAAQAFEVSESAINTAAALAFPRTVKHVTISDPAIELREGQIHVCAEAKAPMVKLPVHFCAAGRPAWHADTATLTGRDFVLEEVSAEWLKPEHSARIRKVLNDAVLPGLPEVKLYEAKNWVGRQVKDVEVHSHVVNIKF